MNSLNPFCRPFLEGGAMARGSVCDAPLDRGGWSWSGGSGWGGGCSHTCSRGGGENRSCLAGENGSCLVGVKVVLGVGDLAWAGDMRSIVLFSLLKSTRSLSPSRSVMADTI